MRTALLSAIVILSLAVGFLAGWRANITFDGPDIRDIPVRVPDRWYVRLSVAP